jgi:hypothetical protein
LSLSLSAEQPATQLLVSIVIIFVRTHNVMEETYLSPYD